MANDSDFGRASTAIWALAEGPPIRRDIAQKFFDKSRRKFHASAGSLHIPTKVGRCLANSLLKRWHTYRDQLRQCQTGMSETAVHQLRVASRRLMTHYALLSGVTSKDKAEKAWRKLKRRMKMLGELRDTQVQRIFIEQQLATFPELILFREFLQRREQRLLRVVAEKIHRFNTRKLEKWTSAFCQELGTSAEDPRKQDLLASNVFRALSDAFSEVVQRQQAIDPAHSQTIHRTRVAFKKFRYMVEALSPAFTGLRRSRLRRLATYQRRMGNLQDLEIMQDGVARFIRQHPETEPFLRPFCQYLGVRRARVLSSCLKHAADLFQFSPPTWSAPNDPALIRTAA